MLKILNGQNKNQNPEKALIIQNEISKNIAILITAITGCCTLIHIPVIILSEE
jgi:hypothetical protein